MTREVVRECEAGLKGVKIGIFTLNCMHTSAGLTVSCLVRHCCRVNSRHLFIDSSPLQAPERCSVITASKSLSMVLADAQVNENCDPYVTGRAISRNNEPR